MVTIGPLIVLGLLGVTFNIGARPLRPLATDAPIRREASGGSRSGRNGLPTTEPLRSGPILRRARPSNTSSQDALEAIEPPMSGPMLRKHRTSAASNDTLALSRSERSIVRAGSWSGQQRTAAVSSENPVVLSRNVRPTAAGLFTDKHRPAGGELASSVTQSPPETSDDATVDVQNSAMVHTRGEDELEAVQDCSATPGPKERSLGKHQRSFRNVWIAGPGNDGDPEQVKRSCRLTVSLRSIGLVPPFIYFRLVFSCSRPCYQFIHRNSMGHETWLGMRLCCFFSGERLRYSRKSGLLTALAI